MIDPGTGSVQDRLLQRLAAGEFGPWGAQWFVPGGIGFMTPSGETRTVLAPGGAVTVTQELGSTADVSGLELDPAFEGTFGLGQTSGPVMTGLGGLVQPNVGGGVGKVQAVISPGSYTDADFVRTELGSVRVTSGISNGATGPLSPIVVGSNLTEVDRNGNKWLPVVRMLDAPQDRGGGGSW